METYSRFQMFQMENMYISPVHLIIHQLPSVFAAHRHSNISYEIHYCKRGHGIVWANGNQYDVYPGTLYMTGPNLEHAQTCDDGAPILEYCLYLTCHLTQVNENAYSNFCKTVFWIGRDTGSMYSLLDALLKEQRTADTETEIISEGLLRQIIGTMIRYYRMHSDNTMYNNFTMLYSYDTKKYPDLEDAFYYKHATLKLDDIAKLLNLSQRQTQRFLLEYYGKSFTQKKTDARMAAAAQLLQENELSISEIAEQTGYSTTEQFSTAFRQYFHMSPREYRKQKERRTKG